ncbi:Uncharacterised protein [Chlamydia abortus]|nr:Uncharacterised protein [Chlamydia abortus]
MFLIFHDFLSCHIPRRTVDISKFSTFFLFLAIFHVLKCVFLIYFSVFLAIFPVLNCVFLIFRDFQFSRHIPGPSVAFLIFHVL